METRHFPLGSTESNRFVNFIRIVFGITCIIVALYWLYLNGQMVRNDGTLWITIIFMTLFGLYLIWAGLGKAYRFIEIGSDQIRLKKNPFFSPKMMLAADMGKIELYPLNVIFYFNKGKRSILRFGTTFYETNEKIKEEIIEFSNHNNIPLEIIEEKL